MSLIENFVQNHVDLLKRNDYIDPETALRRRTLVSRAQDQRAD